MVSLTVLEKFRCRADVAANGADGLVALKNPLCKLVLMDRDAPEIEGYEATRVIRRADPGRWR